MAYAPVDFAFGETLPSAKMDQLADNDAYLKEHVDALEAARLAAVTGKDNAGSTVVVPAGATILKKASYVSGISAGAGGVLPAVVFATAFPNGVISISMTTVVGGSANPVINAGSLSRTGFTAIIPSTPSGTAVVYTWEVTGW